jgi:hypothetical protein
VLDNVEDAPWLTCGACGNDHAIGAVAPSSVVTNVTSPSEDGSSTQFAIAPNVPYTNVYWYQEHQAPSGQLNAITYEFDLYIPSGSENAPQGIEFECQQQFNGWIYNFGWQANFVTNEWRIFNYGPATWDSSGVAFQHFTPGTWHHILAEYHNDVNSHSVWHDALTVDGVRYPLNIRHDAFNAGNVINKLTNAVQLDGNSRNDAYSVYVDRMKITYR